MPTYEYACASCGQHIEVVQSFSEEPLEKCEKCGGRLRRVFHPVGVLFKGSGFYSTDSRTKKVESKQSSSDKSSDNSSDKSKETKADTSKPATDSGAEKTA